MNVVVNAPTHIVFSKTNMPSNSGSPLKTSQTSEPLPAPSPGNGIATHPPSHMQIGIRTPLDRAREGLEFLVILESYHRGTAFPVLKRAERVLLGARAFVEAFIV